MANQVPQPANAAPPPPAPPPPAQQRPRAQAAPVEAKRMGFDPLRPVRYAGAFVWGTATGAMNGLAKGGKLGLKLGVLAAVATWFLVPGVAAAVTLGSFIGHLGLYGLYGFAGGAALSGSLGLLSGGYRGVGREYRREKYGDDLAVKQEANVARSRHYVNYRDRHAQSRQAANYNMDRLAQQDRRTEQDVSTYWQDRVSSGSRDSGRGF